MYTYAYGYLEKTHIRPYMSQIDLISTLWKGMPFIPHEAPHFDNCFELKISSEHGEISFTSLSESQININVFEELFSVSSCSQL